MRRVVESGTIMPAGSSGQARVEVRVATKRPAPRRAVPRTLRRSPAGCRCAARRTRAIEAGVPRRANSRDRARDQRARFVVVGDLRQLEREPLRQPAAASPAARKPGSARRGSKSIDSSTRPNSPRSSFSQRDRNRSRVVAPVRRAAGSRDSPRRRWRSAACRTARRRVRRSRWQAAAAATRSGARGPWRRAEQRIGRRQAHPLRGKRRIGARPSAPRRRRRVVPRGTSASIQRALPDLLFAGIERPGDEFALAHKRRIGGEAEVGRVQARLDVEVAACADSQCGHRSAPAVDRARKRAGGENEDRAGRGVGDVDRVRRARLAHPAASLPGLAATRTKRPSASNTNTAFATMSDDEHFASRARCDGERLAQVHLLRQARARIAASKLPSAQIRTTRPRALRRPRAGCPVHRAQRSAAQPHARSTIRLEARKASRCNEPWPWSATSR